MIIAALGGAIGTMGRYGITLLLRNNTFPVSTLIVNIAGSFAIGLLAGFGLKHNFSESWKIFLITGICGGFTTFSAFSLENLELLQQGRFLTAASYISASVISAIAAVYIGWRISI